MDDSNHETISHDNSDKNITKKPLGRRTFATQKSTFVGPTCCGDVWPKPSPQRTTPSIENVQWFNDYNDDFIFWVWHYFLGSKSLLFNLYFQIIITHIDNYINTLKIMLISKRYYDVAEYVLGKPWLISALLPSMLRCLMTWMWFLTV